MQYNYNECDNPTCEYCALVKQANPGAVAPLPGATQKDLKTAIDDLENKMQTAALQEVGERADGDYNVAKDLGARVDAAVSGLVHGVSVDGVVADKKATDTDGVVYIVGPTPTGTFAGHANQVASLQSGVWHFQTPGANETHLNEADNQMYTWNGTAWVKVGTVGNSQKLNDEIHGATEKLVPGANDEFGITDATETPAFALKKLTWANLRRRVFGDAIPYGTFDNDAAEIAVYNPIENNTYRVPWSGLKTALWKSIPTLPKDNVPGDLPDASIFPIWDTDGNAPYSTTFTVIRDKIGKWLAGSTATGTVGDTDTFLTFMAADGGLRKTTGAQLKAYVASSGGPSYKYINRNDVAFDGGVFIINDITTTTPAFIEVKGMATAVGSANAEAVLIMATGGGYRTDLDTVFSNAKRTGTWGSGGSQNDGGFNDGHFYLNMNAGNASTQLKGNCVATWQLRLYKQSNGWVMIEWQGLYEGGSDTQIFCAGNASALLTGNVTHFGIGFVDAASTHGNRNIFADLVLEVHP